MRAPSTLSIAMPVYNEIQTIEPVIELVRRVPRQKEILIVDDGSTDGTRELLAGSLGQEPDVRVFLQDTNQGKGAALARAFAEARNDIVIVQDADLEYDPDDYTRVLEPIESGRADVVYGSRFQPGARRVLKYRHMLVNRVLTILSNLCTDLALTDMETCYKAFKRDVIQNVELSAKRFGFEPEITAKLAKFPVTIQEVPIEYYGRSHDDGKKITWRDGVAALWHIARFSFFTKPRLIDESAFHRALCFPDGAFPRDLAQVESFLSAQRAIASSPTDDGTKTIGHIEDSDIEDGITKTALPR